MTAIYVIANGLILTSSFRMMSQANEKLVVSKMIFPKDPLDAIISKNRSRFRAESSSLVKARWSPWSRSRQFFRCRLVGRFRWRYPWNSSHRMIFWRFRARVLTGSSNATVLVRSSAIEQSREIPARTSSKRIRTRHRRRPSCLVDWSSPRVIPPLCATRHEPVFRKW